MSDLKLTLLIVTNSPPWAAKYIIQNLDWIKKINERSHRWSETNFAELVVVFDDPTKSIKTPEAQKKLEFAILGNPPKGPGYIRWVQSFSDGYIESILHNAFHHCQGEYILRLDDDELLSAELKEFIEKKLLFPEGESPPDLPYSIAFPRANLYPHEDRLHVITSPPLWPDYQIRLLHKSVAFWPDSIHGAWGGGGIVRSYPPIFHYKFKVRSYSERLEQAKHYDSIRKGAGFSNTYMPFTLPEKHYKRGRVTAIPMRNFDRLSSASQVGRLTESGYDLILSVPKNSRAESQGDRFSRVEF